MLWVLRHAQKSSCTIIGLVVCAPTEADARKLAAEALVPPREHFEHDWGFDRSSWVTACELAKAEGQVWLYADKTTCDPVDDYAPRVVMVAPGRLYY